MTPAAISADLSERRTFDWVEWWAWAGLLGVATSIRLFRIGDQPLDPEEAGRALEAWSLWREGRSVYATGPVWVNLQSLVFGLFTAGDGQARIVAGLAGTAIVGMAWAMRPLVGSLAAWCGGLALALCPLLLTLSRLASPTALALLCVLVVAIGVARYSVAGQRGWLTLAAVGLLVGLGTDQSFVVAVAGLVLAAAIAEGDALAPRFWWLRVRADGPRALAIGLGVALLLDTRMLMNPLGVQAGLIDPFWRWWDDVARVGGLVAPIYMLLVDGGVLLLALVGLLDYRRAPSGDPGAPLYSGRAVRLLGAWLVVAATLAMLVRQPDARYLAQPLVPGALLAGLGLRRIVTTIRDHGTPRTLVLGMAALAPLITAAFHLNTSLRPTSTPWLTTVVIAIAGLLVVALIGINSLRPGQLGAAASTFVLVVVGLWAVTSASRLLESHASSRGHFLFRAVLTDEVRIAREDAHRWLREDPEGTIAVEPSLRSLVAWYLRDVPTARFDAASVRLGGPRILAEPPADGESAWRARRLVVGYAADPTTVDLRPARLWRWVVGRESLVQIRPYAILLVEPAGS